MIIILTLLAASAVEVRSDEALSTSRRCDPAKGAQIVVCGDPDPRSPYRIDPAIALTQQNPHEQDRGPSAHRSIGEDVCPPHGLKVCPGSDTVPVLAIARVAARSAMLAVNGEDWREPFRTQSDQFEEYRLAKAKEDRRRSERKVRFGVFSGR